MLGAYQAATFSQPGVVRPWTPRLAESTDYGYGRSRLDGSGTVGETSATATAVADVADVAESGTMEAGAAAPPPAVVQLVPHAIRIPRIGVAAQVVQLGVSPAGEWEVPDDEVGWYRHTALPGTAGNAVLAGHLNNAWGLPRVFARLRDLRRGDLIEVDLYDTHDGGAPATVARYRVAATHVVASSAVGVLAPTEDDVLTLLTCAGYWNIGRRDYTQRQVVIARPAADS